MPGLDPITFFNLSRQMTRNPDGHSMIRNFEGALYELAMLRGADYMAENPNAPEAIVDIQIKFKELAGGMETPLTIEPFQVIAIPRDSAETITIRNRLEEAALPCD